MYCSTRLLLIGGRRPKENRLSQIHAKSQKESLGYFYYLETDAVERQWVKLFQAATMSI
jgi:hypothetical protein